jgi:hypothetical protein
VRASSRIGPHFCLIRQGFTAIQGLLGRAKKGKKRGRFPGLFVFYLFASRRSTGAAGVSSSPDQAIF